MEIKLKTKHIIMLSRLVSKMELFIDFKGKTQEEIGGDITLDIIRNIHKADAELYEILGDILGYNPEKVADMEIKELIDIIRAVINEVVNFIKKPEA